ncbi:hypothetical protein WL05_08905 [Burkholderia ubonensis]|nr:hypothetical protein WJ52_20805 [Burkholderia ubonensis]KVM18499.1 hypothetical protein WJ51_07345 [Burkholderia ubonensis]KVM50611.1 hypothetical protein WJ56_13840 [Burkholderia ubonensis]KVO09191.1 hypothetical protein WJ73_24725 [Burkholderia ubonensis]KVX54035.1 hypothetical protein WL05_08905 [Burkholderia ubonensis]
MTVHEAIRLHGLCASSESHAVEIGCYPLRATLFQREHRDLGLVIRHLQMTFLIRQCRAHERSIMVFHQINDEIVIVLQDRIIVVQPVDGCQYVRAVGVALVQITGIRHIGECNSENCRACGEFG